ncbi:MAG TPA: hypothetical protein VHZ95_12775, partial [Polyangiales bacterium]|nr:hypothetical protein [Polyangiales bacterium]
LVNPRKEFFRVALADLESYAGKAGLQVKLTLLAEAREYRETLARRAANDNATNATALPTERYPATL